MSIVIRPRQFRAEPHPAGKLATTLLSVTVAGMADPPRFRRGKAYVADGAVTRLEVSPGTLKAWVQGSRAEAYEVIVAVRRIPRLHFGNAESMRANLSQLSPDARELMVSCTCPDWDDPCKHAVAALLAFAEELTARPELLVEWRCEPADGPGPSRPRVGERATTGRHLRLAPDLPPERPSTGAAGSRVGSGTSGGPGGAAVGAGSARRPGPPPSPYATPEWQAFLGSLPAGEPVEIPPEPAPTGHATLGTIDLGAAIASALDVLTSL